MTGRIRRGVTAGWRDGALTGVSAPGRRWSIERCFETAKQAVGLDDCEGRSGTGWHRHLTLSIWARAMPGALEPEKKSPAHQHSGPVQGLPRLGVRLSIPEIRRLLWRRVIQVTQGMEPMATPTCP